MAKPRTNLIIKEGHDSYQLRVWTPAPTKAKGIIEAIEGVASVFHFTYSGCLDVWFNPCYSRAEIKAEIEAALRVKPTPAFAYLAYNRQQAKAERTIGEMDVGEVGYVVSWATDYWGWRPYPEHLGGLNLGYTVHPTPFGTIDTPVCRTATGWVVGGKVFAEKAQEKVGGIIATMRYGEAGYVVDRAVEGCDLDTCYTVFRYPVPPADVPICRTKTGWVVGGKVFTECK